MLRRLYRDLMLLVSLAVGIAAVLLLYTGLGWPPDLPRPLATTPEQKAPAKQAVVVPQASDDIVDGIHVASGLIVAEGFDIVRSQCTACHSGKLVTQNRATREGWEEMIRWMQRTQGLWPLGANEPIILDYLARHYGPEEMGRRANLEVTEWYILNLDSMDNAR